jgi:hypothetical protein
VKQSHKENYTKVHRGTIIIKSNDKISVKQKWTDGTHGWTRERKAGRITAIKK